jgi:hypothetical protein
MAMHSSRWAIAAVMVGLGTGLSPARSQEPTTEVVSSQAGPPICAPRTDSYSTYTEAFMNPDAAACSSATAGEMNQLFKGPRRYRIIFQADAIRWGRTDAGNEILTRTTPNLFDDADGTGPTINADPDDRSLYVNPIFSQPIPNGVIAVSNVNTPGIGIIYRVGETPPNGVAQRLPDGDGLLLAGSPATITSEPITEELVANEIRMQTDDFDFGREYGYRPKIGIEFEDESRLTFTYFKVADFQAGLLEDVSGAAFDVRVISSGTSPFVSQYQRFGYINAPFITTLPEFGGERRREFTVNDVPFPHDPFNESPGVIFSTEGDGGSVEFTPATSSDVPREPTVNDAGPGRLGVLDGPEDTPSPSFLWQDGEVAIAHYSFDIQGGDVQFEKSLFEWFNSEWKLWAVGGLKYLAMDEGFTFTFADIAPPGPIGDTGYQARSPFDRFAANQTPLQTTLSGGTNFKAQPSNETVAIHRMAVDNDIIAPTIGIHAIRPIFGWFEVDLMGAGSFGANFLTRDSSLIRGDGFVGYDRSREEVATSGVFEFKLGMNFVPHPNFKIRAGWEALGLVSIATAIENLDFDLDRDFRPSNNDDVWFFGWYFGGEVVF